MIVLLALSCDKDSGNPVGPDEGDPVAASEYGSIVVKTVDDNGVPTEGIEVTLFSRQKTILKTNAEGVARFDSLHPGRYDLASSSGRMENDKAINDYFIRNVFVTRCEEVTITLYYASGQFDSEYGSVWIRVVDECGEPLEGMEVVLEGPDNSRKGYTIFTSAEGIAYYESMVPGKYNVNVWPGDSMDREVPTIHTQISPITVSAGRTVERSFCFPVGPADIAVMAEILSHVNYQYDDYEIYFPDWDKTVRLDEQGKGVLDDIVFGDILHYCQVSIARNETTIQGFAFVYIDQNGWPYFSVYMSSPPEISIISPENDSRFTDRSVRLTCDGSDLEDGALPDDAFTWSSDLDGDLGYGRDITATLNVGHHTITLTGEDSVGGKSTASVVIDVSHFSDQSYFPLPDDGVWKYRYDTQELIVTTDAGTTERWTLDGMAVSVEDVTSRACVMDWTVGRGGKTMSCRYELTDRLTTDGNRFLVTSTDERFTVSDGDEIIEELSGETAYSPSYPLLNDFIDPQAGTYEDITVTAENAMKYARSDISSRSWTDTETVTVSSQTRSPENVTTAAGNFPATPYISTYNGVERTWWLAQGTGIVQMEYDLFGETVTASLYETNMADFAGGVGKLASTSRNSMPIRIQVDSSAGTPERMREIMDVMRGMCPR